MDPTQRFSDRVENYRRFRPRYPDAIVPFLEQAVGLSRSSIVADIGSGTGIFTEMLVRHGCKVCAVEPNDPMRAAAETALGTFPNFSSVKGSAESTNVAAGSIDIITSAQAFHWFDVAKARAEFSRILKHDGWVLLIWNNRKQNGTPFLAAYEQLLRTQGIGYPVVADDSLPHTIESFFDPGDFLQQELPNSQELDQEGLIGRLLSASYVPNQGDAGSRFLASAESLFQEYSANGIVRVEYSTNVYYGKLPSARQ